MDPAATSADVACSLEKERDVASLLSTLREKEQQLEALRMRLEGKVASRVYLQYL